MILKSPINENRNCENIYFTKNARTAWHCILEKKMDVFYSKKVLLPSYIGQNEKEGSGVFDSIRELNIKFDFYRIKHDLSIDLECLTNKIKSGQFRILLVIHYFGFCVNDMNKIRLLCDENNIILVEDCAHFFSLFLDSQVGNYGDYSFYSIHKYLPSKTGGVLKIKNKEEKIEININKEIDLDALKLLCKSDLEEIKKIRIKNFESYLDNLKNNDNYDVIYKKVENNIPQSFPLLIKNGLREKLYFYLLDKKLPVIALYYRMIDEIDLNKYHISKKISEEIINFPVHQDTNEIDIKFLISEVDKFFDQI